MEGRLVKQPGLQCLLPVMRLIYGLNALEGQGCGRQVNGAAVAVFIILALPDQLGLEAGEGVGVIGSV